MSVHVSPPETITRFTLWVALAWTLVVGASLIWNLRYARQQAMDLAQTEAITNLNKDISFRSWATTHGGVYVPITDKQQPVPWLSHIPGRDVTTTDGRRLTLLNPASMLRQIMDGYAADYGIRGRITGLKYLNPGNAPDDWETRQLESFERGEQREAWAEIAIGGKPHLRYLRAMYMTDGCEKCHAILGYKKGDMRGATGINLPLSPYYEQITSAKRNLGLTHGSIWMLGLTGIALSSLKARRREKARLHAETQKARTEKRYRTLFEQSRDGILMVDPVTLRFLEFNTVAHQQLGYTHDEFAAKTISDIEVIESPEATQQRVARIQSRGWDNFETRHRHKDGSIRDVHVVVQLLIMEERPLLHCTFRDISERKATERALYLYANIFNHSGEGIMITNCANRIIAINPAFSELTGYAPDEVMGRDPNMLASGRTPPETYQALWAGLQASDFWQGELWDRRKDGLIYPKWVAISAIRDENGEVSHYMASFTDISERKAAEERIDYLAHHDALTGLPNRYNLQNRLGQTLLTAHRTQERVAVMFIDLDRFKLINDTLGHHIGDLLLVQVSRRLFACVRESDIVARLGGDEFVVVLTGMVAAEDAAPIARKILSNLDEPYLIEGNTLYSSPSIGISIFPDDGCDSEALMKAADTAMYHAKEQGRNNVQFYTAAMNARAEEKLILEHELRTALQEGQLELHYQPKVCSISGRTCGVEALVRWRHPVRGMVPPLQFIPIAEETGLIEALGQWVLDEACRQLAIWRTEGISGIHIAVNLSAHQLRSPVLAETVRDALTRHGVTHGELELELTESAAMADPKQAIGRLQALRELGVAIAIDDFGTGYSSLAYLKMLPIQILKIDRTFVRDLESDENDVAISAATVALAHSLGLKVVAEGVETLAQSDILKKLNCDFLQGYLYGKPEPGTVWSERWRTTPSLLRRT